MRRKPIRKNPSPAKPVRSIAEQIDKARLVEHSSEPIDRLKLMNQALGILEFIPTPIIASILPVLMKYADRSYGPGRFDAITREVPNGQLDS